MAVLGGSLKRRERLSARLGDILSQLYLSSATLKRFENDGRPAEDLPLVHWAYKIVCAKLKSPLMSSWLTSQIGLLAAHYVYS